MKKIKELQKRSELNEGRDYGVGFTILKKLRNKFETYLPFTACRDYLNDFIYVENECKEIGSVHGYNHKLLNCFGKKRYFYIGVSALDYNNAGLWSLKQDCITLLVLNYKFLESFLNKIEEELKLKSRTSIELDEDTLIIKSPIYWSKTTPLISIYTLLIRCYFNIKEVDLNNEIINILNNNKCFIDSDNYMKEICINFYKNIGKIKFDKIDYSNHITISNKFDIHNFGMQGYLTNI